VSLIKIANLLPRKWVLKFTGSLGNLAYYIFKEAREITINNLTEVFGHQKTKAEIITLAKKVFQMIGKNAGDIIRALPIESSSQLEKFIKVEGEEYLKAALAKGKGVILITGHIGAFELIGSYLGLAGYKPLAIGTAVKDEKLNNLLLHNRTSRGIEAIERGKETFKLVKALKSGRIVIMLIDQDTRVKSRFVNFLGKPAATPIGGALMAQKTAAAVIPIYISMQSDHSQLIEIFPEVPIISGGDEEENLIENIQRISDTTEAAILRNPEQWVWMHERWKTKPGEEIR
jgi:KDO2-lipid IV(A) lauroyltransferase